MIKNKNASGSEETHSPKVASKFRTKVTRSYLVQEYNFLREIASEGPIERRDSPYQEVRELSGKFDGLNLSVRKYKHYKRSSMQ